MQFLIPDTVAWTEGIGGPQYKYLNIVDRLAKSTESLYELQKTLLHTLLNNTDGSNDSPSSRKLFLSKFRRYTMDLSMEQRVRMILINFNNYNEETLFL